MGTDFLKFWHKKTEECFLALDIGNEAVKALVFQPLNGQYVILGSALNYFDELRPFDNDKVIFKSKDEAVIMAGNKPWSLLMSLPPDILKSRVNSHILQRKNHRKPIAKKEEAEICQRLFEETKDRIGRQFSIESGILARDLHFTDFEILEIKIDGYETPSLLGRSGGKIECRILASFLAQDYFNNFSRIAENLGFKNFRIVNPIKNLPSILKIINGIFIDMGGDTTQICLVRNKKIDLIDDFGGGAKDFTRAISENLGMLHQDAKILKENYAQGMLTESARKKVKDIFNSPCRGWYLGLNSKLKHIKELPSSEFFLFGGGSLLPEIKELVSGESAKAKLLYLGDFKDVIDKAGHIDSPQFINSISLIYG